MSQISEKITSAVSAQAYLVVGHQEDGSGWLAIKAGGEVLLQVALHPHHKGLLGYELILGNRFGTGTLPVTLL